MKFSLVHQFNSWFKACFKSWLSLLSIAFIGLAISRPVSANPGDWGMVQRFNKQNELASQGNVKAMYDVGKLYERGRGVVKDISKAAESLNAFNLLDLM